MGMVLRQTTPKTGKDLGVSLHCYFIFVLMMGQFMSTDFVRQNSPGILRRRKLRHGIKLFGKTRGLNLIKRKKRQRNRIFEDTDGEKRLFPKHRWQQWEHWIWLVGQTASVYLPHPSQFTPVHSSTREGPQYGEFPQLKQAQKQFRHLWEWDQVSLYLPNALPN